MAVLQIQFISTRKNLKAIRGVDDLKSVGLKSHLEAIHSEWDTVPKLAQQNVFGENSANMHFFW